MNSAIGFTGVTSEAVIRRATKNLTRSSSFAKLRMTFATLITEKNSALLVCSENKNFTGQIIRDQNHGKGDDFKQRHPEIDQIQLQI